METRVVTVSQQLGCHGVAVARGVAERLAFQYLDREVVERAASAAGVPPNCVSDAERSPSFLKRILDTLVVNPGWTALAGCDLVPRSTSALRLAGLLLAAMLCTVYWPPPHHFFDSTAMPVGDWIIVGVAVAAALPGQYALGHYWQQILDMLIATLGRTDHLRSRAVYQQSRGG